MKKVKRFCITLTLVCAFFIISGNVFANNLSISNLSLGARNPASNEVKVKFDLSWENSWKTKINHDAIWLTVRLFDPAVLPTDKKLCKLAASGLNPTNMSVGSNANLEIYVPADKVGLFIRPNSYGTFDSVSTTSVELTVDYSSCGFTKDDNVSVSVFGLEMAYVPEGSFYVGDFGASYASLSEGSSDDDSWYISSEGAINVSNSVSDGYRYVSGGNVGEDSTGSSFSISASFPKGFKSFYAMKYEITEGQWVEFVNSLSSQSARENRDVTNGSHKNSDSVMARNTISCSGSPLTCSTQRPNRAASYLNWMDVTAFLDWAGLRPISELEFEKIARGPFISLAGEYAWGTTNIACATNITSDAENGAEIVTSVANAHCENASLVGGDSDAGAEYQQGPLRVGIFAANASNRELAGAGYYGIMELSGNLRERVTTIGNSVGRLFSGSNGDGILSTAAGFEGNATNVDWAGMDVITERGVTNAEGSGFRGGAWDDPAPGLRLRVSDRKDAANGSLSAFNNAGGRGVRSHE